MSSASSPTVIASISAPILHHSALTSPWWPPQMIFPDREHHCHHKLYMHLRPSPKITQQHSVNSRIVNINHTDHWLYQSAHNHLKASVFNLEENTNIDAPTFAYFDEHLIICVETRVKSTSVKLMDALEGGNEGMSAEEILAYFDEHLTAVEAGIECLIEQVQAYLQATTGPTRYQLCTQQADTGLEGTRKEDQNERW
ncbi:hypothetical protein DAEQUDRAFT_739759 [Daedalea quercina L-15889]|uniref:Uncharacterized protein n=1 Tax=Daedalea quercina L-15889 TaxID=1314783 RepID=A0A165NEL9_9APHY|nr:hypothetical protein DAEQUDRAFT_739759 [Daedalea quercina L-15889]